LLGTYQAEQARWVRPLNVGLRTLPGSELRYLVFFVALFWIVAITTASMGAVNERELRRRKVDLESLAQMSALVQDAATPSEVAGVLLTSVTEAFDFHCGAVLGLRDRQLSVLASHSTVDAAARPPAEAIDQVIDEAWRDGHTILIAGADPDTDGWLSALFGATRNLAVVPLMAEKRPVGVLVLAHPLRRGSRIERRVVSMVEQFAAHGALALRNAWLLEQLERLATTDGLTGTANRRAFDAILERELERAARGRESLALIMVDLDHFKKLNDLHGHQVGDEVLRTVGDTLLSSCRQFDTVARYGGEEFVLVMPNCEPTEAAAAAERLRTWVAELQTVVPVTASLGVASFPADALDPTGLIEAADTALYESKRAGRNRVTLAKGRSWAGVCGDREPL
jgi:diguanylate cyclase (GGDEF)-like protein